MQVLSGLMNLPSEAANRVNELAALAPSFFAEAHPDTGPPPWLPPTQVGGRWSGRVDARHRGLTSCVSRTSCQPFCGKIIAKIPMVDAATTCGVTSSHPRESTQSKRRDNAHEETTCSDAQHGTHKGQRCQAAFENTQGQNTIPKKDTHDPWSVGAGPQHELGTENRPTRNVTTTRRKGRKRRETVKKGWMVAQGERDERKWKKRGIK